MKLKLVTLVVFLVCVFACWSCTESSSNIGNSNSTQELEIFRTDFKVDQEQRLSKIKAENLKKNNGYLDSDEIVVLINLSNEPLIDTYNNYYSSKVKSVSEYASTDAGVRQLKAIKAEQDALINELKTEGLILSVENTYSTITNAVAVKIKYGNLKTINSLKSVSSTIISDTFNLPKSTTDASAIVNDVDVYDTGIYKSDCVDYTGKGTAVAILDSGFDCSHTVFQHDIDV